MQASVNWASLAIPLGVLAATLSAGYLCRRALFRFLHRHYAGTTSAAVEIALGALREGFMFWVLMFALQLAAAVSRLPAPWAELIPELLPALWMLWLSFNFARIAARLVKGRSCVFGHRWTWPRRRGGIDTQVCSACGFERPSRIQFGACWHHPPFS